MRRDPVRTALAAEGLKPNARLVLMTVMGLQIREPTVNQLAELIKLDRQQVGLALEELYQASLLKRPPKQKPLKVNKVFTVTEELPMFLSASEIKNRVIKLSARTLKRAQERGEISGHLHQGRWHFETASVLAWIRSEKRSNHQNNLPKT